MTARQRAARLAAGTGAAALGLVAALLVGEWMVRVIAPQQLIILRPDLWEPADSVGWLRRPGISVRMNTGERTVSIHTDALGYRVGAEGRRDAPIRVLLMGDSYIEALQVEHEQSVAHLLEEALARRLAAAVVVRNAGVSGWTPNHYLIRTRTLLGRDTFDLVIVALFVGNDAIAERVTYFAPRAPAERKAFRLPHRVTRQELVESVLAPANDALEVRSHLFVLGKNRLAALRMRLGLTADYFPVQFRIDQASSIRWSTTARLARDLARAAARRGTPALFVIIPDHIQTYDEELERYRRALHLDPATVDPMQGSQKLTAALIAESLHVVDATGPFREVAAERPRLFGRVDLHLSPAGHQVLSAVIAPAAERLIRSTRAGAAN
jgi:lysophospholipase L1-like esterase